MKSSYVQMKFGKKGVREQGVDSTCIIQEDVSAPYPNHHRGGSGVH